MPSCSTGHDKFSVKVTVYFQNSCGRNTIYDPGWKGPRASTNIRQRMRDYRSRVTARYCSVPPQTVHFWFDRKLKNHGVTSTLRTFEPSEPRPQHPRLRSTTNFVYHRNTIVPFFTLDYQTWLSVNRTRPPKPLSNVKSCTAITSLRSPFHLG